MARDNNGVPVKVTNNAGQGSVNRGGGMVGKDADSWNGGQNIHDKRTGTMADMASHHGPKGSSGTVKDMGGVGDYGQDANMHKKGFFGDKQ